MRFLLIAALVGAAAAGIVPVSLRTPASERIADEYMVQFHKGARSEFEMFKAKRFGMKMPVQIHEFSDYMGFWVRVPDEKTLMDIQQFPGIASIEPNTKVHAMGEQVNVPAWGVDRSDQRALPLDTIFRWQDAAAGQGIGVFVLDTGVLTSHSDYNGRAQFFTDCTGAGDVCQNNTNSNDPHGHGTHCAGSVGSTTYGVAKEVSMYDVRVLGATGGGTVNGIVNGIQEVVNAQNVPAVRIMSMSLGGGSSAAMDNAVDAAFAAGVLTVAAAGNENTDACSRSPAGASTAFTIAASDSNDNRATFSNYGSCVDIYAPGVSVLSTYNNGGTATLSGTSMACPHVAGAAAMVASRGISDPAAIKAAVIAEGTTGVIGNNPTSTVNLLLYTSP